MPLNIIGTSVKASRKKILISLFLTPKRHSSPSFNMVPIFSLDVSFLLLFILLCISYLRTGTAFKISLTGANSVPADFFSKGTLTHQIAPVKHKIYKHKSEKEATFQSVPNKFYDESKDNLKI